MNGLVRWILEVKVSDYFQSVLRRNHFFLSDMRRCRLGSSWNSSLIKQVLLTARKLSLITCSSNVPVWGCRLVSVPLWLVAKKDAVQGCATAANEDADLSVRLLATFPIRECLRGYQPISRILWKKSFSPADAVIVEWLKVGCFWDLVW